MWHYTVSKSRQGDLAEGISETSEGTRLGCQRIRPRSWGLQTAMLSLKRTCQNKVDVHGCKSFTTACGTGEDECRPERTFGVCEKRVLKAKRHVLFERSRNSIASGNAGREGHAATPCRKVPRLGRLGGFTSCLQSCGSAFGSIAPHDYPCAERGEKRWSRSGAFKEDLVVVATRDCNQWRCGQDTISSRLTEVEVVHYDAHGTAYRLGCNHVSITGTLRRTLHE
jgi:hypothetical protein